MFPCERCGLCCQNVGHSPFGKSLALANGVCKYFNSKTKLCIIYYNRPFFCNIDAVYNKFYRDKMSKNMFFQLNKNICKSLQEADSFEKK